MLDRMYFQHDGATAYFSIAVRNHLRATSGIDGLAEMALCSGHPDHLTSRVWISSSGHTCHEEAGV